jgi:acetylornithine deacetylase
MISCSSRGHYKNCPDALIDWYFFRLLFECNPNERIGKSLEYAYQHVMGKKVENEVLKCGQMPPFFQNAGIPTVNLGLAGFGVHEPIEWIDLDSVAHTAMILFHTAQSFFQRRRVIRLNG